MLNGQFPLSFTPPPKRALIPIVHLIFVLLLFVVFAGFGSVVNALGIRMKPYLPQTCGTIKWRLNNKSPKVRMQAAGLI